MSKVVRSLVVKAPLQQVFDKIQDPARWPKLFPGVISATDIERTAEGVGTSVHVTWTDGQKHAEMVSTYAEFIPNARTRVVDAPGDLQHSLTITYETVAEGTKLTVEDAYVPSKKADPSFDKELEHYSERQLDRLVALFTAELDDQAWDEGNNP